MWHSTTPSSFPPHTCKRAFRAVLPERHQHLSCVVCPGSFAHVAFGLGLFALVAFVRAEKAESRGRPVVGPVVCLRFHRPAKFKLRATFPPGICASCYLPPRYLLQGHQEAQALSLAWDYHGQHLPAASWLPTGTCFTCFGRDTSLRSCWRRTTTV